MKELPPPGICRCGCGEPTEIATKTNYKRGAIRGEPQRYRQGHGARKDPSLNGWKAQRRTRSEAARDRNRELQALRNRARLERDAKRAAEQERLARKAGMELAAKPFVAVYRDEKKRKARDLAPLLLEAKRQLEREDEMSRLARRGGRPKKVVARG
jgi:hypothetical protein